MVFSEVFWTGLYTAGVGVILAVMNQCYKSKCREIDVCCIEEHLDKPATSPIRHENKSEL